MREPFLFCAHHRDNYPVGNGRLGPVSGLAGRDLGSDFGNPSGWNMYHGETVPGFPVHPHRGFETVTIVLTGFVDHADSMGASGRYGMGDVQWMTAGSGCQHAEMFPLINTDAENPLELFQVWLNLPARDKFVAPSYKMLWSEDIPMVTVQNEGGAHARVRLIAGSLNGETALSPTPNSWAAKAEHNVSIMLAELDAGAALSLPAVSPTLTRTLYYYRGGSMTIDGESYYAGNGIDLPGDSGVSIENGSEKSFFLLLAAEPIGEPIAKYGPFVMNTKEEIADAYNDYQRTHFGGWPWPRRDQVHGQDRKRFAKYANGRAEERPAH
ncbi:MAG TPA: pirin family protein [Bacillota bacterium]|nr:pirin family protein [Bacillota bacterium]